MQRVDWDGDLHRRYSKGRALSPETLAVWMGANARHVPPKEGLLLLDLGSGTGRFTGALARRLGARVIGVEPSDGMRGVAEEGSDEPAVSFIKGRGEEIPLPDSSCDAALLSMVLHHLEDMDACCAELARVLRADGRVLLRHCFAEQIDDIAFYEYFPAAKEIDLRRMPSFAEARGVFERAGFEMLSREVVTQEFAPSFRAYYERMAQRALSTFELISDEDFETGLAAMKAVADSEREPAPVLEHVDLVVFGKQGDR